MGSFFMICFGVGVLFIVISFIFGEIFSSIDFHLDSDFDFGFGVSPFRPVVIAVFAAVFGGVGLIVMDRVHFIFAIVIAFCFAIFVSFIIYRFVIVTMYKFQSTSAVEIQSLIGLNATVTENIEQGGYGKITYYAAGNTFSAPAKAEDGSQIGRSEKVLIVYIEKNTFYVRKKLA